MFITDQHVAHDAYLVSLPRKVDLVIAMPKSTLLDRMRLITNRIKLLWASSSTTDGVSHPAEELLAQPNVYRELLFQRVQRVPRGKTEDTPLFSLYRIYEHLVLNDNVGLRNEQEYFWYAKCPHIHS